MTAEVSYGFSIVGTITTVALLWWLARRGGERRGQLGDAETVRALVAGQYPYVRPDRVLVARDGRAALAFLSGEAAPTLVFGNGAHPVVWTLEPGALAQATAEARGDTLLLRTGDFTRPTIRFVLPDGVEASALTRSRPEPDSRRMEVVP